MNARQLVTRLTTLADRWPDLEEARLIGTARPRQQGPISDAARARKAERDRAELDDIRRYRLPVMGFTAAPLHVDVLDVMAGILMDADVLHEAIAQTVGHPTLRHPPSAYADPRPYLAYAAHLLPEALDTDRRLNERVEELVAGMEHAMLTVFGEVHDGQQLEAVCPFCCGRTFVKPAGEKTLRVRVVPDHRDPTNTEVVVVCENEVGCRPFEAECGMWVKGRPAWPWSQWEWLAERLIA